MSLGKSIRLKRLKVKEGEKVELKIDTRSGRQFSFPVVDLSISGLAVKADLNPEMLEDLREDEIVPASKLVFGSSEATLGRLVIKRMPVSEPEKTVSIGMATIDAKVPVDGPLSKHLDNDMARGTTAFDHELGSNQFSIANFVGVDFGNVDLFERTRKFGIFYEDWRRSDKFGYFMKRTDSEGPRVKLTRKRKDGRNDYLVLGSNDYLGLAAHPAVKEAAINAIRTYGFGSTGTPHTSGYSDLHDKLCRRMASLYNREDAVIYASGYAANVGILSGLCRERDLVVADTISHASMHDGIAMSRATCRLYKHNDMNHLEKILAENRDQYAGCLIATEGAFSMDGTIGRLDEIHRLARKYNARVFVDQAHCLGVVGRTGLGAVEKFGLVEDIDIVMGLFSKSLGSVGGFVVGSSDLCNWLRSFSRAFIFATSVPPSTAAATLKAIDVMQAEGLVEKLQGNIKHLINGFRSIGVPIDPNHETAIMPVEIRNEAKMGQMYQSLLESGVMVIPVVYPVVSRNRCRFRFSVRADLTTSDLDYVVSAFERAMKAADFDFSQLDGDKAA